MKHKIRNKTLRLAREPLFRMRVVEDKTKYNRKRRARNEQQET